MTDQSSNQQGPRMSSGYKHVYLAYLSDEKEILQIERGQIINEVRELYKYFIPVSMEQKAAIEAAESGKRQTKRLYDLAYERLKQFYAIVDSFEHTAGKNTDLESRIRKLYYELDHDTHSKEYENRMRKYLYQLYHLVLQQEDYKNAVIQARYLRRLYNELKAEYGRQVRQKQGDSESYKAVSANKKVYEQIKACNKVLDEKKARIAEINKLQKKLRAEIKQALQ